MTSEGKPVDSGPAPVALLERYQRAERIGEGTIFTTYRGQDARSGRVVALQVLKQELARDPHFVDCLCAEIGKAQRVQHPGIVAIEAVAASRHRVVVATEFVRGVNLKERIRRVAPFPLAVAIDIALACAEALEAAAGEGIAHGDLRPANIVITPEGRIKIGGFGVGPSLAASNRIQLTALAELAPYLAPERAQGAEPDSRSDIYSLGIILYEMLGAVTPFVSETPLAIAVRHLHDPPPPLSRFCPGVPRAVEGVVLKCLQKDPGARYASMASLANDLRAVREGLRLGKPLDWTPASGGATAVGLPPKPSAPASIPVPGPGAPRQAVVLPLVEPEPGEPSTKLLLIGLAGVLLVIAAAYVVGMIFFRTPPEVAVPNVLGKPRAAAVSTLLALGLPAEVTERFNEKMPPGVVYLQDPDSNRAVRQGNAVRIFVSKGPQPSLVPDVVGKSLKTAQSTIREAQLSVGSIHEEYNDSVPKGDVISQDPAANVSLSRHQPVSVVVSKGPEPEPPQRRVEVESVAGDEPPPGETPETAERQWEVVVRVPQQPSRPQNVRIVVRDQDGSEHDEFNEDHDPGEEVRATVKGVGAKNKVTLRVYVDGRRVHEQRF